MYQFPKHNFISPEKIRSRLERSKKYEEFHVCRTESALPTCDSLKNHCISAYDDDNDEDWSIATALVMAYCIVGRDIPTDFIPSPDYLIMCASSGMPLEDCFKQVGVCSQFTYFNEIKEIQDLENIEIEAAKHRIREYFRIPINDSLLATIESAIFTGNPVLGLLNIYSSFESGDTGNIPLPNPVYWGDFSDPRDAYLGGHMLCIVGYSQEKQLFTAINCWGNNWGNAGFCDIPYAYLANPKLGLEFLTLSVSDRIEHLI
jgi:hypothetical protein